MSVEQVTRHICDKCHTKQDRVDYPRDVGSYNPLGKWLHLTIPHREGYPQERNLVFCSIDCLQRFLKQCKEATK